MQHYKLQVYLTLILGLLFLNTLVFAKTIHVPAAQPTIQAGIDAAKDGDTVLVADGIYKGDGNVNIDFSGKRITVKSRNGAEATLIDCEENPDTRGFIFQNQESNDSVLDGFTIKNGIHTLGAGIYCNGASPTIKNCVVTKNRAGNPANFTGKGGGIYCKNSSALIEECTITHNFVGSKFGGGVHLTGEWSGELPTRAKPRLINCTISENTGSGIYSEGRTTTVIKGCTISKNTSRGVVCTGNYSWDSNLIINSRIEQNADGGIEVSQETAIDITESIIRQNTADSGGGISCSRTSTLNVSECIIAENTATKWGGGLDIESWSGKATITHSTITRNTAGKWGGGIFFSSTPASNIHLTLTNSIVWGNTSEGSFDEAALGGNKIVIRTCDIGGGLEGLKREAHPDELIYEDNIDEDPRFVNADSGDYRLKPGSPAAAMGPQSSLGGLLSVAAVGKRLVKWAELKRR